MVFKQTLLRRKVLSVSVDDKMQEFLDQGAIGAYSGASKVLELIGEGKSHLVSRYLEQIRNYGDNSKVRGIVDIVYEMGRADLLEEAPVIYTGTNTSIGVPIDVDQEVCELDFFIDLKEATYMVEVQMDVKDEKDYSQYYDVDVFDNSGNTLKLGYGYSYDDRAIITVSELEVGICKVVVNWNTTKGTMKQILISPWVYKG